MTLARRSRVTSTSIALTFTAAIVLSGLHLAARPIHRLLFMSERVSGSIFGGMAAAYVFLYLLPELETTHDVIGEGIHFVILLGFLLSYGAEHYSYRLRQRSLDAERAASWSFNTRIVSLWIYNALFIYTLPAELEAGGFTFVLSTAAISLHLIHADYELSRQDGVRFYRWGRWRRRRSRRPPSIRSRRRATPSATS